MLSQNDSMVSKWNSIKGETLYILYGIKMDLLSSLMDYACHNTPRRGDYYSKSTLYSLKLTVLNTFE